MNYSLSSFVLSSLLVASIFSNALTTSDVHGQSYANVVISEPVSRDSEGNSLTDVMVGQLTVLSTTLSNNTVENTPFVAIMEVRNRDGVTEYLNWQSGTLTKNAEVEVGISWTPARNAVYTLRTFAFSSFTNPEILSLVAVSEVAVTAFATEAITTPDLDSLSGEVREDLVIAIANAYKIMAEPYGEVEYEWLKYQIRFGGSTFYNERESYIIWSNATAKINGTDSHETYTLRGTYNSVDKLVDVTISHDTNYLPKDSEDAAIKSAVSNPTVKQFFARNGNNETSSPKIIIPRTGYLDSREVNREKYSTDNTGTQTERPEFKFLPDSAQVIVIVFVVLPRDAVEAGEEIAGVGTPLIRAYLDPASYKVLGTYEFRGNQ